MNETQLVEAIELETSSESAASKAAAVTAWAKRFAILALGLFIERDGRKLAELPDPERLEVVVSGRKAVTDSGSVDRKGFTPYHSKMMKDRSVRLIIHRDEERAGVYKVAIAILKALAEAVIVQAEFRGDITKAQGLNARMKEVLDNLGFRHQHPKTGEVGGEITNIAYIAPGKALLESIDEILAQIGPMPDPEGVYLGRKKDKRGASQKGTSKFYEVRCSQKGCIPGTTGKGKPKQYGFAMLPMQWPGEDTLRDWGWFTCPKHGESTVSVTKVAETVRDSDENLDAALEAVMVTAAEPTETGETVTH